MTVRNNIPIYSICWLNHAEGGLIGHLYEPESVEELKNICSILYEEGKTFDLIGHTSNIYFLPNYSVDYMVSTRQCNQYVETYDEIICDCGVSVMKLARKMVKDGIKGFEGLIDLPGTVAAAVYGNASCYNCSINALLVSCELLRPNGEIVVLSPKDLRLSKRSSVLKRSELTGVILSVILRKEKGNVEDIKKLSEQIHLVRKVTQPGPRDNLGSIYAVSNGWSLYSFIPRIVAKSITLFYNLFGKRRQQIAILLKLLGASDLMPYVHSWNRFIWKDERAHELFWKFHKLHQKMFKKSQFEIEIKGCHQE